MIGRVGRDGDWKGWTSIGRDSDRKGWTSIGRDGDRKGWTSIRRDGDPKGRLEGTLDQNVVDGRVGSRREVDWKDADVVTGRGLEG